MLVIDHRDVVDRPAVIDIPYLIDSSAIIDSPDVIDCDHVVDNADVIDGTFIIDSPDVLWSGCIHNAWISAIGDSAIGCSILPHRISILRRSARMVSIDSILGGSRARRGELSCSGRTLWCTMPDS
jgi:hypothetical protein